MKSSTRSHRISRSLALLALSIGSISTIGVSVACADTSDGDAPSKTVNYAGLNLNTAVGTMRLYRRIRYAAIDVCSPVESRSFVAKMHASACESQAIDSAVSKVGDSNLTAYYVAHGGKAQASILRASLDTGNVAR
jgi:UrcA family protein